MNNNHQNNNTNNNNGATGPKPAKPMVQPVMRLQGSAGYGRVGRPIKLTTNTYDVNLKKPETFWVQYAVSITAEGRPGSGRPASLPPKELWRKIWNELEQQNVWAPIVPVYDGRFMCFAPDQLPGVGDGASYPVQLPGQRTVFNVQVYNKHPIDPMELIKFYASRADVSRSNVDPALVALNTLMVHGFGLLFPVTKSTFYISNPAAVGLPPSHQPFDVSQGIELWRGFFSSIRPTLNGLYLNVDTTTGAFIKPGSMITVCCELLGHRGGGPNLLRGLQARDRIKLNRILRNARIDIDRAASTQGGTRQQLKLKIRGGVSSDSARDHTFSSSVGNQPARMVTVEDYYLQQYNIRLQYPDLPMIETKPNTFYPIELCSLSPGNKYNKRLAPAQTANATNIQLLKPTDRMAAIEAIRRGAINQVNNQYLDQFGVSIGPQPKQVNGRVFTPPTIEYHRGSTSRVAQGSWKVEPRGRQQLLQPARLASFGVVIGPGRVDPEAVYHFLCAMLGEARSLGLSVPEVPGNPAFFARGGNSMDADFAEAVNQANQAFNKPPELIFAVFESTSDVYDRFKALGLMQGVATQALKWDKIRNKTRDFQTQVNIALKLNAKLRGTSFRHVKGTTSGDGRDGWLEANKALIFGVDLSHQDGKPSIASVVMSVDRTAQSYIEASVVQPLTEPADASETQRAKRCEVVKEMDSIVYGLLSRFEAAHPGAAPPSLLFYRDGVSDGEWESLLKEEIPAIRKACDRMVAEHPTTLGVKGWNPKITFVLCAKRHHIRFFPGRGEGEGKSGNIPAGTVVDSEVTDPRAWDWYAAHHTGILGTTRPIHYVVMEDENGFTPDQLQALTGALAHSYQRCHRAVSIPAPVYYADLIALRLRSMITAITGGGDGGAGSAAGTASTDPDARQRAIDLTDYRRAMEEFEQGREVLGNFFGKAPSMWWL